MFTAMNASDDADPRLVPLSPKDYYVAAYDLREIAAELENEATGCTDPSLAARCEDMAARLRNAIATLDTGWRKRRANLRVV